ncbi:MAG: hypothetical protein ACOY40_14825 [Bacillota bacterium]
MEGLLSADSDRFDAELAWQKLKLAAAQREKQKKKGVVAKVMRYKKFFTAEAASLALAGLFSFTPVRTMAGDFLTIFRVEKVKAIAITPEDMSQLERLMKECTGRAEIKNFGKAEVTGRQEVVPVTPQEARDAVDFELKIPYFDPYIDGYGEPQLKKVSGGRVTLALDVGNVNAALQALGSGERLPDELNGKEFSLTIPTGITADYKGAAGKLTLIQIRGPSVQTSAGVDVKAIRQALLSVPGLPENLRKQLAAVDDWQRTALIPVRAGQFSEVRVNGTEGVFIRGDSPAQGKSMNALVWQEGGVIYALGGEGMNLENAMNVAGKMK